MRIISNYIARTVCYYILLVVILLLGLQAFIEFSKEFPQIGTGYYGILQVLMYVPLMLPSDVYQFFPMAGLLGTVIALGLLAANSELIVMRASGMSLSDITLDVFKAAIMLIFLMLIIGEIVAPLAQRYAIAHKTMALSGGQTLITRQGMWVRNDNDYVHISQVLANGDLKDITRYSFADNKQLKIASNAATAKYINHKWVFHDIVETNFSGAVLTANNYPEQEWDLKLNPKFISSAYIDVDQKTLPELYCDIRYQKQSGLNTQHDRFTFWQRVFAPFATLVMILLAIPFVFGPLRSATMGLRMMGGIILGFVFYILNQFVGPMSVVYQVPPFIAAMIPMLLFMVLGWTILLRVKN